MTPKTTHERLQRLHEIIIIERECAKKLDIDNMLKAVKEKEELIQLLSYEEKIDEESKPLAAKIRNENRRNAFLLKSTLGWIRETLQFLGKKSVVNTYSAAAISVPSTVNGRLLSGTI
ncbi:MAG: flagellar protein FlgN [Desulfotalea sp.]